MSIFATGENAQKILDLLDKDKLVSDDFEDVRKAFEDSNFHYIGSGQAFGANMFEKAAKQAMESLLYYEAAQAMIIWLQCPSDSEQGKMEAELSKIICPAFPDAPILWCADLKDDFIDEVHIDIFAASNIDPELKVYKYDLPCSGMSEREWYNSTKIIGNDEDGIPDPTLYHFALEALNCRPEEFTGNRAATLYKLTIRGDSTFVDDDFVPQYHVRRLKGIAYFKNLMYLRVESSRLTDLSPLADLQHLCEIHIDCPVQCLEPINGLNSLSVLNSLRIAVFSNCEFVDISALANFTRLEELNLFYCGISDISPLSKLTRLKSLDLQENYIQDVSPLAGLTQLESLTLTDNNIQDITPLINLTQLRRLELSGNAIEISVNTIDILRAIVYNNPQLKTLSF